MRYWDSSAVVPLIVDEEGTELARGWLADDQHIVTWGLTRLEITAAIERRAREGSVLRTKRREMLDRLERLAQDWDEIVDLFTVRTKATALVARHPIRAADAAQLGAALLVAEDDPASLTVACLDGRLAQATEAEGLRLLTWPDPTDS